MARAGASVTVDSCNPIELTRREWEQVARDVHVLYVNIEVACSDPGEHRKSRRPQSRGSGLRLPTWQDVLDREYDSWSVSRIVIDTANRSPEDSVNALMADLVALKAQQARERRATVHAGLSLRTRGSAPAVGHQSLEMCSIKLEADDHQRSGPTGSARQAGAPGFVVALAATGAAP